MTAKNYTVILMRPDYVADNYGQDSYAAWVTAADPYAAIRAGQQEVYDVDMGRDPDSPGDPHGLLRGDPLSRASLRRAHL